MSRLKNTINSDKSLLNFDGGFSHKTNRQADVKSTSIPTPSLPSSNSAIDIDDITIEELPLEVVKAYLRVDHDLDDLEIRLHMQSAIAYVRNYINQPEDKEMDMGLLAPILSLIAYLYENKSVNSKTTERLDSIFSSTLHLFKEGWL